MRRPPAPHRANTGKIHLPTLLAICAVGLAGVIAFVVLRPKPTPPKKQPQARRAKPAKRSDLGWLGSGWQRSRNRSKRHKSTTRKQSAARKGSGAPGRRLLTTDGAPPESPPEAPPGETPPKKQKDAWIRGKVVALPSRQPITTFTIHYAPTTRNYWSSKKNQKRRTTGFPKDLKKKSVTRTHPKGHFKLKAKAGRYIVQITAKGYTDGTPTPANASTRMWFLRTYGLLKGGRSVIKGRVLGRKGKAVAGAYVAALLSGGSRWGWRMMSLGRMAPSSARLAYTDNEGNFTLKGLPAGRYGVSIQAAGYIAWQRRGIALADGEIKELGVIKLGGETATLKGTVYDADEKGKSGATVAAIAYTQSGRTVRFARTESSGEYELNDIPAGKVTVFASLGRGMLASRRMAQITLKGGETKTHDFHFGSGGVTLSGTVIGPDNQPIAGAKVSAMARITKPTPSFSSGNATTNTKGEFSISGLQEGVHTLTVEQNKKPSPGGTVDVKGKETTHTIRLQGGAIEVQVISEQTKKPLDAPVWAVLSWKTTKTQRLMQQGKPGQTIVFSNLPERTMSLRIFSPGYSTHIKNDVTPGEAGKQKRVTLALKPEGKLMLTVNTPDKKNPSRLYAMLMIEGQYKWVPSQPTPGGELLVQGLPPGAASLKIVANDYQPYFLTVTIPTKGNATSTIELIPKSKTPPAKE